nr:MAG TPA: hypothetical protein [Caudoviricetes sp.]DAK55523.1 MAG TPA: hypothetical protein [Caudoviricetes sp.]
MDNQQPNRKEGSTTTLCSYYIAKWETSYEKKI